VPKIKCLWTGTHYSYIYQEVNTILTALALQDNFHSKAIS